METRGRRIRVILNRRAGRGADVATVVEAIERSWTDTGADITFQLSGGVADSSAKARRAMDDGIDTILVAGGDGIVNTVGAVVMDSDVVLGVIPTGSGNGFARHFGIPLQIEQAARCLAAAQPQKVDVGTANGRPFFVTCSMAADASLMKTFEAFPFRGIMPYVFAAAYEWFDYQPQPFRVVLDDAEELSFSSPLVFTVANLSQYGGGARIAPQARHDDGCLELVVIEKQDTGRALANVGRLFDGTIDTLPGVVTRRFRTLRAMRQKAAVIQVDGELQESGADVVVGVRRAALNVLVPPPGFDAAATG